MHITLQNIAFYSTQDNCFSETPPKPSTAN